MDPHEDRKKDDEAWKKRNAEAGLRLEAMVDERAATLRELRTALTRRNDADIRKFAGRLCGLPEEP
jgi:hypothetical protein